MGMHGMHGMKPCGCGHGHGHPFHPAMVFFPIAMVLRVVAGAFLLITLVKMMEVSTYTRTLRDFGDRLSESEKAELEGRIRQRLFSCGFSCGHS